MTNALLSTVIVAGILFIGACLGWTLAEHNTAPCGPLMTVAADQETH